MTHALAWEYLKRNPDYCQEVAQATLSFSEVKTTVFSSFTKQTKHDLPATNWKLYAYAPPSTTHPFWVLDTTLDAEITPNAGMPIVTQLKQNGADISGLRLLDGTLIVKIHNNYKFVQLRFKKEEELKLSSGIKLSCPINQHLSGFRTALQTLDELINQPFEKKNIHSK